MVLAHFFGFDACSGRLAKRLRDTHAFRVGERFGEFAGLISSEDGDDPHSWVFAFHVDEGADTEHVLLLAGDRRRPNRSMAMRTKPARDPAVVAYAARYVASTRAEDIRPGSWQVLEHGDTPACRPFTNLRAPFFAFFEPRRFGLDVSADEVVFALAGAWSELPEMSGDADPLPRIARRTDMGLSQGDFVPGPPNDIPFVVEALGSADPRVRAVASHVWDGLNEGTDLGTQWRRGLAAFLLAELFRDERDPALTERIHGAELRRWLTQWEDVVGGLPEPVARVDDPPPLGTLPQLDGEEVSASDEPACPPRVAQGEVVGNVVVRRRENLTLLAAQCASLGEEARLVLGRLPDEQKPLAVVAPKNRALVLTELILGLVLDEMENPDGSESIVDDGESIPIRSPRLVVPRQLPWFVPAPKYLIVGSDRVALGHLGVRLALPVGWDAQADRSLVERARKTSPPGLHRDAFARFPSKRNVKTMLAQLPLPAGELDVALQALLAVGRADSSMRARILPEILQRMPESAAPRHLLWLFMQLDGKSWHEEAGRRLDGVLSQSAL